MDAVKTLFGLRVVVGLYIEVKNGVVCFMFIRRIFCLVVSWRSLGRHGVAFGYAMSPRLACVFCFCF